MPEMRASWTEGTRNPPWIGFNPALSWPVCRDNDVWKPVSHGSNSRPLPPTGRPPTPRCSRRCSASCTSSGRSRRRCSNSLANRLVHGPAHSSIGQEGGAVGSIVGLSSTDAVNGSHRGHHQFLAKAITHVSDGTLDLERPRHRVHPDRAAAHARRDPRPGAGLLRRPWRFDASPVVRGRSTRHQRDRRRRCAHGDRQRVGTEALRHDRPHHQLLRRRRQPDRLGARVDEPRRRVEASGLLLHREQPLRGHHEHRRVGRRHPPLGARSGLLDPVVACRRHGPARRAPRDEGGGQRHAFRRWPRRRRGRGLPLLPPERALPGQRVRLPQQRRGSEVARA